MTRAELEQRWTWKPIRNCPGRFVLATGGRAVSAQTLVGGGHRVHEFRSARARDRVLVVPLEDGGGLISYAREDGSLVHTLNTPEGFARKLADLGITLGDESS